MGKRGRRQAGESKEWAKEVWQTARVRVDDETWTEYRRLLGDRSVAEALGAHVEAEVAAWRRRQASRPELEEREVLAVLARIEDAKASLEALTVRLELRLPVCRPVRIPTADEFGRLIPVSTPDHSRSNDWRSLMTAPVNSGRTLFVTLPVEDLERSKAFFEGLGFSFDPAFSGESAACMLVGEHASVMLGTREMWAELSHKPMADPKTHGLALFSFSVDSREEVDSVSATALAAGATEADGAEDHGFPHARSFYDLDGHGWQVMWMDPAAAEQSPEAFAAAAAQDVAT